MPLFNRSKLQSLFVSIILSLLTLIILLLYNYFTKEDIGNLLLLIIPLFIFSFLIVFLYLEFYVFKKIRNLYRDLYPLDNKPKTVGNIWQLS